MKKYIALLLMLVLTVVTVSAIDLSMTVEGDITVIDEAQESGLWTRYEAVFSAASGDVDFSMAFGYTDMSELFPGDLLDWTLRFWMLDDLMTMRVGNLWVNTYRTRSVLNKIGTLGQISGNALMLETYAVEGLDAAILFPFLDVKDTRMKTLDMLMQTNLYARYDYMVGVATLLVDLDFREDQNKHSVALSTDIFAIDGLLARLAYQLDMNFGAGSQASLYSVGAEYDVMPIDLSVKADWFMRQTYANTEEEVSFADSISEHGFALGLAYNVLDDLSVSAGSEVNILTIMNHDFDGEEAFGVFDNFLSFNAGVEYALTADLEAFAKIGFDGDLSYRMGIGWGLSF